MQVTVEFLGTASVAAGRRKVSIELPATCTGRDVLKELSKAVPKLVGHVIEEDQSSLISPNVMDLNGVKVIHDYDAPLALDAQSTLAIGQSPC